MRCVWCDSEYTFTGGEHVSLADVMQQVHSLGCKLVEVTGGEPLAQKQAFELIRRLCDDDFEVLVETGNYVSTAGLDPRAKVILDIKRSEEHTSELQSQSNLVCRLLLEKKKQ